MSSTIYTDYSALCFDEDDQRFTSAMVANVTEEVPTMVVTIRADVSSSFSFSSAKDIGNAAKTIPKPIRNKCPIRATEHTHTTNNAEKRSPQRTRQIVHCLQVGISSSNGSQYGDREQKRVFDIRDDMRLITKRRKNRWNVLQLASMLDKHGICTHVRINVKIDFVHYAALCRSNTAATRRTAACPQRAGTEGSVEQHR